MGNTKHVVEINGIKMEIDLRHATVVENYKIGDPVKVLIKDYTDYKSYAGVIVGFDNFKERPTIIIAYLKSGYNEASIHFAHLNKDMKDCEIVPMTEKELPFSKQRVIEEMNSQICNAEEKVRELKNKKEYFLTHFQMYFKNAVAEM